jgi:DNA processing protein
MLDFSDPGPVLWSARQLLWLQRFPGIGSGRSLEIARAIPNPANFRAEWPGVAQRMHSWAAAIPAIDPEEVTDFPHLTVVGAFDDEYPTALSAISNPPAVLWVRGDLRPDSRNVAIVGTRQPTDFGASIAHLAAIHSAQLGLGVVSGLALGVDAIAHEAALDADGYTVAVLGGSLESPQPQRNRSLADRILESGGALICETLPDATPAANTLVARNRIQSGLSVATVIAQSGIPGGTLHTARFAIEQGRRLIVPRPAGGRRTDPANAGNVALTDPDGIDPAILKASRKTTELLAERRPVADDVPETPAELKGSLDAL